MKFIRTLIRLRRRRDALTASLTTQKNPLEVCPVWISQHKETKRVQAGQAPACAHSVRLFVCMYVSVSLKPGLAQCL